MLDNHESLQRADNEHHAAITAIGVAAELQEDILGGAFESTQRLPPERVLARRFGASRGTIRAALKQLQNMNLVVSRQGSGTYVTYRDEDNLQTIVEVTSPLELIECRLAIEPHLVRLAVADAGQAQLDRMQQILDSAEAKSTNPDDFSLADEQFHLALAQSASNPLLLWIYRRINEIRHQTQWHARKDHVLTSRRMKNYNQQHRELFEAISARDINYAVQAITTHLKTAREQLLGQDGE